MYEAERVGGDQLIMLFSWLICLSVQEHTVHSGNVAFVNSFTYKWHAVE